MRHALAQRARQPKRNPRTDPRLGSLLIAAGAGFGLEAVAGVIGDYNEATLARIKNNQLHWKDVLLGTGVPIGGATLAGIVTGDVWIGLAFAAGAYANSVLSGGRIIWVNNVLPWAYSEGFQLGREAPVDLGPYGAPGFAWDKQGHRVTTIRERTYAGEAHSLEEALAAARRFMGA